MKQIIKSINKIITLMLACFILSHHTKAASVWDMDADTGSTYQSSNFDSGQSKKKHMKQDKFKILSPYGRIGINANFASSPNEKYSQTNLLLVQHDLELRPLYAVNFGLDFGIGANLYVDLGKNSDLLFSFGMGGSLMIPGHKDGPPIVKQEYDVSADSSALGMLDFIFKFGSRMHNYDPAIFQKFNVIPYAILGAGILLGANQFMNTGNTSVEFGFGVNLQSKNKPIGFYTDFVANVFNKSTYVYHVASDNIAGTDSFEFPVIFSLGIFRISAGMTLGW